jgi:uncharacterized membrane protein YgaE (UPF0421/DUF939 family)
MGKYKKYVEKCEAWLEQRAKAIWTNLQTNHLWQRILKNTIATTIAVIIAIIPSIARVYGKAAYLAPLTTVFGHPGRRFGMMAEALALSVAGTFLGLGWSMLGLYFSSLIFHTNKPAAYTIKGVFLAISLLFHGILRSHTPRLFLFVLLLVIVTVVTLTGTATTVTKMAVTQLLYPILTAVAVILLVNISIFPEFSSRFLGITTIDTLGATVGALRDAGKYFVNSIEASEKDMGDKPLEATGRDPNEPATAAEESKEKTTADANPSLVQRILHSFRSQKNVTPKPKTDEKPKKVKLKTLTDLKSTLRAKLASCKAAQQECNFELAWAVLPPKDLKPISVTAMKELVANVIALIGACESKYALMGDRDDKTETETKEEDHIKRKEQPANGDIGEDSRPGTGYDGSHTPDVSRDDTDEGAESGKEKKRKRKTKSESKTELEKDIEMVKPRKEIEFGDIDLLKHLVSRIAKPLADLQERIVRSVDVITSCLAYCYDVPKLPSGARRPAGIRLEEIDIHIDTLVEALQGFDKDSAAALERAAALEDLDHPSVDIMPRMEIFLISSFLLNLRQAAFHTLTMLRHSRVIVDKYQARHGRQRLYVPKIHWRKWLTSGGEEDMLALPEAGRKEARTGNKEDKEGPDEESSGTSEELLAKKTDIESAALNGFQAPQPATRTTGSKKVVQLKIGTLIHKLRNALADTVEYLLGSEDVAYAIKLTVAVFLVSWPAFVYKWNTWYSLNRGLWAALQLILITEVALGTSVMTFTLRAFGTTVGCLWGWAAYEIGGGNRVVGVVMLAIGVVPSAYIQLGSKYVKAGMVSIISMSIVLLATEDKTVPGSATENFLKRFIAFLIGGVVALIVELVLFPVRARDRLVESLAASIRQIIEMEGCLAYGIDTEANVDAHSAVVSARFQLARGKADGALAAAETFLPFCANEPRLKGSFKGLALIYSEILYVLHSIVDKMDNMHHLRQAYGSGVLEELNTEVYPYRRNVAGSVTLILFAVHEGLTTKLPLPQFFPSARLAHLRMVNRVREVILSKEPTDLQHHRESGRTEIELSMVKRVIRQKFLSWMAASAGQIEVIEYLEELIDLVKLLVGANEFRSGLLTRPTYREYVERISRDYGKPPVDGAPDATRNAEQDERRDTFPELDQESRKLGLRKRRPSLARKQPHELERKNSRATDEEELERRRQAEEEELPMPLQRVRTRRQSVMNITRTESRDHDVEIMRGGKRADRSP